MFNNILRIKNYFLKQTLDLLYAIPILANKNISIMLNLINIITINLFFYLISYLSNTKILWGAEEAKERVILSAFHCPFSPLILLSFYF